MVLPSAKCPGSANIGSQNSDAADPKIFVIFAVFCVKSWKTGRAMARTIFSATRRFLAGLMVNQQEKGTGTGHGA